MRRNKPLDVLLGAAYGLLVVAIVAGAVLAYNKAFTSTTDVVLQTGTIGNALQSGSDVKLKGVPVGKVTTISTAPDGAELTLALDPEVAGELSTATVARLLPKTLFGERYVALYAPDTAGDGLSAGDTIHQDSSAEAVELEDVFDQLLPVLQSIQPDKLSAMLGELATMLRGQGEDIGTSMASWGAYLKKLNPHVPQMADDFEALGEVAFAYDEAVPDLLEALDAMRTTAATLTERRDSLADVYANVIGGADESTGWISANQQTIEVLAEDSQDALAAVEPYADQFPCLFDATAGFVDVMDKTLGAGTDEPGMHVVLNVVESRGKYLPHQDRPQYAENGRPSCPYVTGSPGTSPAKADHPGRSDDPETIAPPPTDRVVDTAANGLGPANSPGENALIGELVGPTQGVAPADYPDWASLLVGPTLRNAKVSLQ